MTPQMNPLLIAIDPIVFLSDPNVVWNGDGLWRLLFYIGMLLLISPFMRAFKYVLPWQARSLWAYLIIWGLYIVECPTLPFGDVNTAFIASGGIYLCEVLLIPTALVLMGDFAVDKILKHFRWFIAVEILLVFFTGCGVMLAPSFDTALIALYVPFAPLWISIPSILLIATKHGSTAIMILIAQLIGYVIFKTELKIKILGALSSIWLVLIAALHSGVRFNADERVAHWIGYMKWWNGLRDAIAHTIGTGPGTFMWLSMSIDKWNPPFFTHMHSDWLQILFELGPVGLGLVLLVVYKAIKLSRNNPTQLAAIFGCCAISLTYHGLRWFPTLLLMGLIFRKALVVKDVQTDITLRG